LDQYERLMRELSDEYVLLICYFLYRCEFAADLFSTDDAISMQLDRSDIVQNVGNRSAIAATSCSTVQAPPLFVEKS